MSPKWETTAGVCLLLFWSSLLITSNADDAECDLKTHYLCDDTKTCVPKSYLCNNNKDCPDGDDEVDCGKQIILITVKMILTSIHKQIQSFAPDQRFSYVATAANASPRIRHAITPAIVMTTATRATNCVKDWLEFRNDPRLDRASLTRSLTAGAANASRRSWCATERNIAWTEAMKHRNCVRRKM